MKTVNLSAEHFHVIASMLYLNADKASKLWDKAIRTLPYDAPEREAAKRAHDAAHEMYMRFTEARRVQTLADLFTEEERAKL